MKTIMMIRSDIKMAGPGILMEYYAKELIQKGYKVVICSGGGELNKRINNIKYYEIEELLIEKRGIINNIKAIKKIYNILKKENIDIVHGYNSYVSFLSYISTCFMTKKIKCFNTVLGVGKEWINIFLPMKIIAVSKFVKEELVKARVNRKKIIVLENGIIDLNKFNIDIKSNLKKELGILPDEMLIGVVAMITGKKGHLEAINTYKELSKINSKIKLCLIGDGVYKNEYENYCKEKKLDGVIFLGKRVDIPNIMKGIDLFLHLSQSETFGMVIVEAMSMGKVVVANNIGGIPEIIEQGKNGFLVNRKSYYENAILINNILLNNELKEKIGRNNIEKVKNKYTINKTIERLIKIYEDI